MSTKLFNFRRIGIKLLIAVLVIDLVVICAIMLGSGIISSNAMVKRSKEMAIARNEALGNRLLANFSTFYQLGKDLEVRVHTRMERTVRNRQSLREVILDGLQSNQEIQGLGIYFEPNQFDGKDEEYAGKEGFDSTGRVMEYYYRKDNGDIVRNLEDGTKLDSQEWYRSSIDDGEVHITEPYVEEIGQEKRIFTTMTLPIKNNGQTVGIILLDIDLMSLQATIEGMTSSKVIYLILSPKSHLIAHGMSAEHMGKAYDQVGGSQESMDKITRSEDFDQTLYSPSLNSMSYIKYTPVHFPGAKEAWTIAAVWSMQYFNQEANQLLLIIIGISLIGLVIVALAMIFISRQMISRPMGVVEKLIHQLAEFNFIIEDNQSLERLLLRKDEIGSMASSMRLMTDNIKGLLQNIVDSSQTVAATSEELTATAETNKESVQEISDAVEEIAHTATEQAHNIELTSENVESIGQNIEQNLDIIHSLTDAATEIEKSKNEGNLIIQELIEKSEKNSQAVEEIFNAVRATNESAERIETVSGMIQAIADQTNLLALNAAIEAARAGESGKGFAVVAEEIRKLAEQSTGFTGEIKQVINDLKARTEKAVAEMNEVIVISKEQKDSSHQTEIKFELIAGNLEIMRSIVTNLRSAAENMKGNKEKIVSGVGELTGIAQQNAASSEEVASTIQNQLESIVGIAEASNELSRIASDLQVEVQRFKI